MLLMGEKSILGVGSRGRHNDTILAGSLYVLMMVHSWNEIRYKYRKIMRIILLHNIRMRANWRNIVDQQLPALLDVTSCVRLHTLLHVVGCCYAKFETGQTFQPTTPDISFVPWSPKRSATMLDRFAQLFQRYWGHARSLCMVYKDLWVVSFPRCTAGLNIVGSCCIRLQTTANTNATTPKIVGATMLGVVASVCTQPNVTK